MKALITGGAGFIGLHLARHLQAQGFHIDLLDNFSRGIRDQELGEFASRPHVNLLEADLLASPEATDFKKDYTHIFHLAAIIGVAHVVQNPFRVLRDNQIMLLNALEIARQNNIKRFVFASTSEIYAGTLQNFDMAVPTPEKTPLALTELKEPRTSYMLSKIYGEALCLQSGLPVTIVRPHNFYGPRMGLSHVLPELLLKAHRALPGVAIDVFSPEHRRTFCYISDAVEMIARLALAPQAIGEAFNIGRESPELKIEEVARLVIGTIGKDLSISKKPATAGSPERRCPSMEKTKLVTGYSAKVDLQEGLTQTYDWYRQNVFDSIGKSAI